MPAKNNFNNNLHIISSIKIGINLTFKDIYTI